MSETYQPELTPVETRSVYPEREVALAEVRERIADGRMQLQEVSEDQKPDVNAFSMSHWEGYQGIDFSNVPHGTYHASDAAKLLSPEDRATFLEANQARIQESCAQLATLSPLSWWLEADDTGRNSWLDTATLHEVDIVEVADKKISINDFSGKIHNAEFLNGLQGLIKEFAAKGIDVANYVRAVNVVPADHPRASPSDIRGIPAGADAYVPAWVDGSGAITFNERIINEDFELDVTSDGLSQGWKDLFKHEMGHLLDFDQEAHGFSTVAPDLGWVKRANVFTDDYGNLHEKNDGNCGLVYITDDYGTRGRLHNLMLPEMLVGKVTDESGKPVGPPSRYGETKGVEDVADSFTVYMGAKAALDSVRQKRMEKLVRDRATMEPDPNIAVAITRFSPHEFNPYDHLLTEITYKNEFYA